MKFIASVGAVLTIAAVLIAMMSPASSQTAPLGVVKTQPIGPAVIAPNAEIDTPTIATAPGPEEEPPRLPAFEGVIEGIGTKYTIFSHDGAMVRSTATPGPEKQGNVPSRENESDEEPDETP
jgi:hypothetical protein